MTNAGPILSLHESLSQARDSRLTPQNSLSVRVPLCGLHTAYLLCAPRMKLDHSNHLVFLCRLISREIKRDKKGEVVLDTRVLRHLSRYLVVNSSKVRGSQEEHQEKKHAARKLKLTENSSPSIPANSNYLETEAPFLTPHWVCRDLSTTVQLLLLYNYYCAAQFHGSRQPCQPANFRASTNTKHNTKSPSRLDIPFFPFNHHPTTKCHTTNITRSSVSHPWPPSPSPYTILPPCLVAVGLPPSWVLLPQDGPTTGQTALPGLIIRQS